MDDTRAEGFTSDGRNTRYEETGLQTLNKPQEREDQQPPEPQQINEAAKNYKSQES